MSTQTRADRINEKADDIFNFLKVFIYLNQETCSCKTKTNHNRENCGCVACDAIRLIEWIEDQKWEALHD